MVMSLDNWNPLLWSILGWGNCLNSKNGGVGCHQLRIVDWDCSFVSLPTWDCRLDFAGSWIFWSGLLECWDWVLYSAISRMINWLPCPCRAVWTSLFAGSNQSWVCTELPGQARPLVLLWRWGKPQAMLFKRPYAVLLDDLCRFLWSGWVPWHGQTCWRLYWAMSGIVNYIPCLSTARKAALKPGKLFDCCPNSSRPTPQVP